MKRKIGEKQLLRMLDIPSFRHMTKEKIIDFASVLSDVDPEVAKKALEQFPNFAAAVSGIAAHYKDVVVECMNGSDPDTHACLMACSSIIETIQAELVKEEITPETRERLIDQSIYVAQIMRSINQDSKAFRIAAARIFGVFSLIATCTLLTALGTKASVSLPEPNEDERVA